MDQLNRIFSEQKLERIEKTMSDIMKINGKLEDLENAKHNMVKHSEMDRLEKMMMKSYATK